MPFDNDIEAFFYRLKTSPENLLLLDYDGTLAPFVEDPRKAIPYRGVPKTIDRLVDQPSNRVMIISGRMAEEVKNLSGISRPIEIWGCHGWQYMEPGEDPKIVGLPEGAEEALDLGKKTALEVVPAGRVEVKVGCVAAHWRGFGQKQIQKYHDELAAKWGEIVDLNGLELRPFDGGLELRVPGRNKGDVVNVILEEIDLETTCVAYLGDDLTDEDAFEALGDRGLSILVRPQYRETKANSHLVPPEEIIEFLTRWHEITAIQGG